MKNILLLLIVIPLLACDPVRHERYSIIINPTLVQSNAIVKEKTISTSIVAKLISDTAKECQYPYKLMPTEYPEKNTVEFGFFEYGVFILSQEAKNTRNEVIRKLREQFGDQVEIVKID